MHLGGIVTFGSRAGLVAAWIGDFAHLGTREVMDDLFSDGPLREADNGRLHRHSRWDQRTGGVGASLAYFCLFTYRDPRGEGRGGAAAATQTFRGDGLQRRRGYDVDIPRRRVAVAPRPRRASIKRRAPQVLLLGLLHRPARVERPRDAVVRHRSRRFPAPDS